MNPRPKEVLLLLGFLFAGVVALAGWGMVSRPPVARLSLSLNGYTNADWVRLCYRIPSGRDNAVALFQLDNKTDESFLCFYSRIQLHTKNGWSDDPNWDVPSVSRSSMAEPGKSVAINFPVPSGICNWRCSVWLSKVPRQRRPAWQTKFLDVIHRAGITFATDEREIWSREIVRKKAA
jgi:hypothetical protein